ncbi:MAG: hypothetical protein ACI37R_01870 [Candidatus Avigastranaerophilus sp.]
MTEILSQQNAPIYEALEKFRRMRIVPFDVPGHKRGRGNPELVELLGNKCVGIDVNSMKPLDNLCHPVSMTITETAHKYGMKLPDIILEDRGEYKLIRSFGYDDFKMRL